MQDSWWYGAECYGDDVKKYADKMGKDWGISYIHFLGICYQPYTDCYWWSQYAKSGDSLKRIEPDELHQYRNRDKEKFLGITSKDNSKNYQENSKVIQEEMSKWLEKTENFHKRLKNPEEFTFSMEDVMFILSERLNEYELSPTEEFILPSIGISGDNLIKLTPEDEISFDLDVVLRYLVDGIDFIIEKHYN